MRPLKDAGILLVVILLALSVRFTPLEESGGTELDLASLTPQTGAAPEPTKFELKPLRLDAMVSPATAVTPREDFSIREGDRCTEMVIHIEKAAEETRNKRIERKAREVRKVAACSA